MQPHAFVIEAEGEAGVARAHAYIESELGLAVRANPDVVTLRYGLLSVEEARSVVEVASQAPLRGDKKAIVIAASRAYHEAQNALLKLFEEPPEGTFLFLLLPTLGGLLPTLRSRVQILDGGLTKSYMGEINETAEVFLKAGKEKRSALIKKLASGKDEEERRSHREEAIAIVNGIEAAAFAKKTPECIALLEETSELRAHLYDRSAPVRMILEHLALVLPKGLL